MKISRPFYLIVSLIMSFTLLSCTKRENSAFKAVANETIEIKPPSCGSISLTPKNALYPHTSVSFEAKLPKDADTATLEWNIAKQGDVVLTNSSNSFVHSFSGLSEGPGDYVATFTFKKTDGDVCALRKSFQILKDDICVEPSGISGQLVGYVDEQTTPFSIDYEDCFQGTVSWDMNNDGLAEYTVNPFDTVTYTYTQSGTYTVTATVVDFEDNSQKILYHTIDIKGKSCINPFTNDSVPHGDTVEFAKPNPECGERPCLKTQKICNNGKFDGDETFTENPLTCNASVVCPVEPCINGATNPPQCTTCPEGKIMINGQCTTVSYNWKVGEWGECSAKACGTTGTQARDVVCKRNDGVTVLDSFCPNEKPTTSQSCSAEACGTCLLPWGGTINHNQKVTAFKDAYVPYGSKCRSQTRTCKDGKLTGKFTHKTCTVNEAKSCELPWGGTIKHGEKVEAYQSSNVSCGKKCRSQTRTCINGRLTGSFTKDTCTVNSCNTDSCKVDNIERSCKQAINNSSYTHYRIAPLNWRFFNMTGDALAAGKVKEFNPWLNWSAGAYKYNSVTGKVTTMKDGMSVDKNETMYCVGTYEDKIRQLVRYSSSLGWVLADVPDSDYRPPVGPTTTCRYPPPKKNVLLTVHMSMKCTVDGPIADETKLDSQKRIVWENFHIGGHCSY